MRKLMWGAAILALTACAEATEPELTPDVAMVPAVVELGIGVGGGAATPLQINTNLEPRHADWHGVRLTVLDLQPAPRAAEPTRHEDYSARIRVEPIR